jgi:hypothetical protein
MLASRAAAPLALRSHPEVYSAMRSPFPLVRMAETSQVKSWYDAGLRLSNEPESPTLSPVESWFDEGLAVVERRNQMAAALAQKRKAMLLKREGRSAILRREGIANYGVAKAAEIAATKKAAVASKEEERRLERLQRDRPLGRHLV